MVLRVRCDVDIFKLTASAPSINREVYGIRNEDSAVREVFHCLSKLGCLGGLELVL